MSANKDLIVSLYEAYSKGDAATFFGALHEKVEWKVAEGHPNGGTFIGLDAIVRDVQSHALNDWDGFGARPSFITATDDEDTVLSTGTYSGTNKATGKHLEARFCHVWRIEDGRITHFESISDSALFHEAMS
jgi:ketosteroid isomerase-like protein